ncbi:RNA-binding protein 34 [Sipha flava]|uniref:RNA-binding protein 34 n=1 Tax=Sipha flava TaxID=143950 RepID=A0A8B8GAQ2_9HEMI|nr:RNA-binding protein 34 [Sipha flava]
MDDEYTVGALCDSIASQGKKNKTIKGEIMQKKKKVKKQLKTEINAIDLPENSEKSKKKRSKNNDLPKAKKQKTDKNCLTTQNEIIETKPHINDENLIKNNIKSLVLIKKNKNSINFEKQKKNTFFKKPDMKSSAEYIEKKPVSLIKNEKVTDLEIKNKNIANFEKRIKKKKTKNDNLKQPNDKSITILNKNKFSKKPDIKSSTDYIEKESRTVFVGNVPVNIKMTLIKKLFKQFGEVETTRLRSVAVNNLEVPKRVSIMKGDFHPQRNTANVYVRFKTVEEAQRALVLNATTFEGHTIRVDMALNSGHKQNKNKGIFIGNLPYNIQEDEIWEFFNDCGIISAVRLVRDNATGVSKGFGYVDFETKESVELALQLDGKKIQNRGIRIKRIDVKPNAIKGFNKQPVQFKRTKKVGRMNSGHNFQGETMKPKMQKKKPKATKTDLMRKKIAKQLNA